MTIMGGEASEAAMDILIDHQRRGNGNCLCGWGTSVHHLGQSHAAHVVHELQMAGIDLVWR